MPIALETLPDRLRFEEICLYLYEPMDTENKKRITLDKKAALLKAEHFCAYQERSQQEVRDKLYSYGLKSYEVEELISELIQTNFLSEERFAIAYCLGKFRMKRWGKIKIKQGLKLKRVPGVLINKALARIDAEDYERTLREIIEKKSSTLKEPEGFKRRQKLITYAMTKGFEKDLIFDVLNSSDLE